MWSQIDLLSDRRRLQALRTSLGGGTAVSNKPYAVIYDPASSAYGDDQVVQDLAQLWAARAVKDYVLSDTIRRVLGGRIFIHSDCIEWLSIGEDGTWG